MLKTLDILIGATTVLVIFSMAVTILTQAATNVLSRRGAHLADGLADMLQQLGIPERKVAENIADAVLKHPLISQGKGWAIEKGKGPVRTMRLGTIIHREEFTKLLLDAAGSNSTAAWPTLDQTSLAALRRMLAENGVSDPGATLKNVRSMAMQLEASNPELATDVRQNMAILHEASSDYVARINSWFDQTIDRVSQRFSKHTHAVTLGLAAIVVITVQLDMIAVVNRLSVDEGLRNQLVESAIKARPVDRDHPQLDALKDAPYYEFLSNAGLVTMPVDSQWIHRFNARKIPGMVLGMLLISLGAPFWYNILKDLLGLRSTLAKKDDLQRAIRQTSQDGPSPASTILGSAGAGVPWLKGEKGRLEPWG